MAACWYFCLKNNAFLTCFISLSSGYVIFMFSRSLFTISDVYFTSIFKTSLLLSVCFFLIEGNIKQYWADKNNTKLICKIVCHLVTVYTLHHCIWNSEQLGGFVFAENILIHYIMLTHEWQTGMWKAGTEDSKRIKKRLNIALHSNEKGKKMDKKGEKLLRRVSAPMTSCCSLFRSKEIRWKEESQLHEKQIWDGWIAS